MKFVMHRNRTIVSTSGHAVEFVKGELTHVPPAMYEQVMAAGAVPEEELDLDPKEEGKVEEPTDPATRQKALFAAMEKVTLRGKREEFTASGAPHAKVLSNELGWTVSNKERDTAWAAFQTRENE
jgi:hypothetical protein